MNTFTPEQIFQFKKFIKLFCKTMSFAGSFEKIDNYYLFQYKNEKHACHLDDECFEYFMTIHRHLLDERR